MAARIFDAEWAADIPCSILDEVISLTKAYLPTEPAPICGVYQIRCTATGNRYIGQSHNIPSRWSGHRSALRAGSHYAKTMQSDWSTYGEDTFIFSVLCYCEQAYLLPSEKFLICQTAPEYNACKFNPPPKKTSPPRAAKKEPPTPKTRVVKKHDTPEGAFTVKELMEKWGVGENAVYARLRTLRKNNGVSPPVGGVQPSTKYYEFDGHRLTARQWAEKLSISLQTFKSRVKDNLPPERLFAARHRRATLPSFRLNQRKEP